MDTSFRTYESREHELKATDLLTQIGKFVVAFEDICASMRSCIDCAFRREGLRNQLLSQAVVHGQSANSLRQLLGNVFHSLRGQDDDDRQCVRNLLKRIEKLAQERNRHLHSQWFLTGSCCNANSQFAATTLKLFTDQAKGPYATLDAIDGNRLAKLLHEATEIQVLLQRLTICLNQTGFRVSVMFRRPL